MRQAALAAMLGLIIFGGGGWVVADQQLRALRGQVVASKTNATAYADRYLKQMRAEVRVEHIEAILRPSVDWVGHLAYLSELMPPPERARIESITGSVKSAVEFVTEQDGEYTDAKTLAEGEWIKTGRIEFAVAGSAARPVANTLRETLIASKVYTTATRGPDVADKFEYQLVSTAVTPREVLSTKPETPPGEDES